MNILPVILTRALVGFLILSPLLAAAPVLFADDQQSRGDIMTDAMRKMMEAMKMINPGPGGSAPTGPASTANPFGAPAWMPGGGGDGAPWGPPPPQDPAGARERGGNLMERSYPGASPLAGVWEGRNGELVIVQGRRFRIYPGAVEYVDGYVLARDGRMAMYLAGEEEARPFEYSESEGRLVLRDTAGQVYHYRRLRLDAAP
jgi:hypothetical protein